MEHSDLWPAASLAELLRGYRLAAGLTQLELAARAGLSVGAVRDLEQGRRRPRPDSVARLAEALGLEAAQARDLARAARADVRPAGGLGAQRQVGGDVRLEVLGPLAAWRAGTAVVMGGPARRAVLGLLAVAGGSLVHRETIIDVLWPDDPPSSAVNVVQAHVSALRRALEPGSGPSGRDRLLASAGASYELRAGPGQLDLLAFRQLTARARAARSDGDDEAACGLYQQALGLWRGEPLADVDLLRGHPAVTSLARQRTETVIEYARTASAAGWHDRVQAVLREVAGREPLNEQVHALLMVALAGSGQQAEALAVYRDLCRRLDEELGIAPGPEVAQAHQQVLRQDIPVPQLTRVVAPARPAGRPERAATQPVVTRQLPAAPPLFTGREAELMALDGLLTHRGGDRPAMAVISAAGPSAGVGKTALAVHWAHQVADRFPDGQLYVNLRGYDAGQPVTAAGALAGFLHALGMADYDVPPGLDERAAMYRSLVQQRRMLIVLDNARDADQVGPLLPGGWPSVVIVISRSQLTSLAAAEGAYPVSLDVLSAAEASELLARQLGQERAAAEADAVTELAELCARLPLALAIAAARAALHPGVSVAAMVAELRDTTGKLDALDAGDTVSVRAVLSWSYHHLPPSSRRMFRLLGIHPEADITVTAAASLAGAGPDQTREILGQLVEANLLTEHAPGRYQLHDLLRAYAAERARAEDTGPQQHAAAGRRFRCPGRRVRWLGAAFAAVAGITVLAALLIPARHANQAAGGRSTPRAPSNGPTAQASSRNSVTKDRGPVTFSAAPSVISEPGGVIDYAAFNADGSVLATVNLDGTVDFWNPGTFHIVRTLPARETKVDTPVSLAIAPNGTLAIGGFSNAYILNPATGTGAVMRQIYEGIIGSLDYSQDGKILSWSDGVVYVDDLASGTVTEFPANPDTKAADGVAFSPDGADLAVADQNGSAYIWDLKHETLIASLPDPGGQGVNAVAYSPDGKFLAAAGKNGKIYLWNLADHRPAYVISEPQVVDQGPLAVAISPDGKTIVSVDDYGAYVWKVAGLRL